MRGSNLLPDDSKPGCHLACLEVVLEIEFWFIPPEADEYRGYAEFLTGGPPAADQRLRSETPFPPRGETNRHFSDSL